MIQLINGNCLIEMQNIPDESVDAIICDLPYGTTKCKWDAVIPFEPLWRQYNRIIKRNGAIVLFSQSPFDKILACSNIKDFRYEIIWEKTQATGHLNAKKMPMKSHENILVFYKKLPTYNPQMSHGHARKVSKAIHKKGCNTGEMYGECNVFSDYDSTDRYPRDVIIFSSDKQTENYHPTQKPVALLEYLVKTYTNEGNIVLDNCMGSGTTGVACKNLNRSFIGIEMDDKYFEIAKSRINYEKANLQA